MSDYLNMDIKEMIGKYPAVAGILEEYGIGCVTCQAGSCRVKDVLDIHTLPSRQGRELLSRLAREIDPGGSAEVPDVAPGPRERPGKAAYSPPLKRLVDEHVVIKKVVGAIGQIIESLDLESEPNRALVRQTVEFIRQYADKYHHAKEEDILFAYFDANLAVIKAMRADHENARAHVRAILDGLEQRDADCVAEHLGAYRDLLSEHIKREDEILYVWMDRNLSMRQIGQLYARFAAVDENSDMEAIRAYERFANQLEVTFGKTSTCSTTGREAAR